MPFPEFQEALRQFLNEYSALFMTLGQNLFRSFATILIVWFGIQAALSSAEDRAGFHFSKFVTLILTISFNYFMIFQYSAFFHLITDQGPPGGSSDVVAGSDGAVRAAVTYVAGMTDRFAFRQAVALLGWDPAKLPAGVDALRLRRAQAGRPGKA